MRPVDHEVERYLTLLRNKIRERGFTQLEVQEALGWGRSYISQLLTRQKALRVEQVLLILNVVGMDPADFFAELYGTAPRTASGLQQPRAEETERFHAVRTMVQGLADLLVEKGVVSAEELAAGRTGPMA